MKFRTNHVAGFASARSLRALGVFGALLGCLPACGGTIGGDDRKSSKPAVGVAADGGGPVDPSGSGPSQPGAAGLSLFDDTAACASGQPKVGPTPLRRLSRVEYDNMVRDLGLGDSRPAEQFVAEQKIPGNFNSNSYAAISGTLIAQQYLQAAEKLATGAVATGLERLLPCAPAADEACARQFIGDFAARAFRGQLDDPEAAALLQLYKDVSGAFDFATGIEAVITSVLTSPRFLFVLELGAPGASPGQANGAVQLTPLELATRLSLYLWRSLPDPALVATAKAGQLGSADELEAQATRMLADPRATGALQDFANQWLDVENVDAVTKDTMLTRWTPALAKALHTETLTTFSSTVLAASDGSLTDLLTSPYSYIDREIGDSGIYAGAKGAAGADFVRTRVDDASNPRSGVLTSAAVLASHAHTSLQSPVLRGRLVRQQLLCEPVPAPPAAIDGVPIPPPPSALMPGDSVRGKYEAHERDPRCSGCHQLMDPIGFGFNHYDATGAYMASDPGSSTSIDASGRFVPSSAGDLSGTFTDAAGLISQLAASPRASQCYALQQLRYALGRVETGADACAAKQLYSDFAASGFKLRRLLIAVIRSDAFRYRSALHPGSACQ